MKFKAVVQDIPEVGEAVTVLDETGDVFFHVSPDRVSELIGALPKSHVLEFALRTYVDTLFECLKDENLTDEERTAFEKDMATAKELLG